MAVSVLLSIMVAMIDRVLALIFVGLVLSSPGYRSRLTAQEAPNAREAQEAPRAAWVSRVGQKVARHADAGVVATVRRITRLRGGALGRLVVDEILFGRAALGVDPRLPGPKTPASITVLARVPDYFPAIGTRVCLMLRGRPGQRYQAISRLALDDEVGRTRLALLRRVLAAEVSGTPPVARALRVKRLMFETIETAPGALHLLAFGELLHLLERYPTAFDRRDLGRLRGATSRTVHPRVAKIVARLSQKLGRLPNTSAARKAFYRNAIRAAKDAEAKGKQLEAAAAELESESIELLATHLADPAPAVRVLVARLLGRLDDPAAGPPLVTRLVRETETAVRAALADAIGRLRFAGAVDTLRPLLNEPEASRPAMLALGRIGSPAARETLGAWRERLVEAGDEVRAKSVDFVLSSKFVEQEARVDRIRRKSRVRTRGR